MFAATIEDGRSILVECSPPGTYRNALEQVGWQLESEGAADQQVTITFIEQDR